MTRRGWTILLCVALVVMVFLPPFLLAGRDAVPAPTYAGDAWTDTQVEGQVRASVWDNPLLKVQILRTAVTGRTPCTSPAYVDDRLMTEARTLRAYGVFGVTVAQASVDCVGAITQ